jgi:hypothetical protein
VPRLTLALQMRAIAAMIDDDDRGMTHVPTRLTGTACLAVHGP